MRLNRRGSLTLIGLLVVVVIIAVVFAVKFAGAPPTTADKEKGLLDEASTKQTTLGKAIDTAKSTACREQLRQIRAGIDLCRQSSAEGGNPASLKDAVPNVSSAYFQCPVSNQPYTYDPAAGIVSCPTHADY